MLNIKNSALGCIMLLLTFFFSSSEARYPKDPITPDCTGNTFCIKKAIDKITPDSSLDEKAWQEAIVGEDLILHFHPILH